MVSDKKIKYAGFWPRLLAHNIDLIPMLGLFYLTDLVPTTGYDFFIGGGIYLFYHSAFELSKWHATPGKKLCKLYVGEKGLNQANPIKIIIRNTSKILSLLLFFGGFILIFFNHKRRALHDYIGGTLVLFEEG